MKLINESMKLSIFFFFFLMWNCESMRIWLANLANFNFFFFSCFCLFKFGCPHTMLPCILHAHTLALITNFFFFFMGPVVQPQQCLCVVCLCVISVFVFGGCVCVLSVHILPKFQFWNWNLEKNNLKKFWKSYNINNIGFFFVFF